MIKQSRIGQKKLKELWNLETVLEQRLKGMLFLLYIGSLYSQSIHTFAILLVLTKFICFTSREGFVPSQNETIGSNQNKEEKM